MKSVTLSNGVVVDVYVGDGFDGGSGVFPRLGRNSWKDKGSEIVIPDKDIKKVRTLLRWYVREEMKLRLHEGQCYAPQTLTFDVPNISNPYQTNYLLGNIEHRLKELEDKK